MWITNTHQQSFLYFKSVTLVSLVSQNAEWGCARRCVVKNHTSHSGTRHLNWNIKVWQHPYPKQILISERGSTKQNKHTQKYFAFHRSPIELQIRISTLSGAANKELNPQKHHSPSKMHFHVITDTARAYGSYSSRVLLVTTITPACSAVSLSWEWIVKHQKAVLLAEGLTSKIR